MNFASAMLFLSKEVGNCVRRKEWASVGAYIELATGLHPVHILNGDMQFTRPAMFCGPDCDARHAKVYLAWPDDIKAEDWEEVPK